MCQSHSFSFPVLTMRSTGLRRLINRGREIKVGAEKLDGVIDI